VAVRAWDSAANTQPEHPIWNPKGCANNSWHTVNFEVIEA
jgi:Mo-co oxidoreductase dimerisation domain